MQMDLSFVDQEATLAVARSESTQSAGVYASVIRWALVVGVFMLPIFFLPWTTNVLELNKQLLLLGVAGTGLIAWLISLVSTGRVSWRITPFDKGVLAVTVAALVATVLSVSRVVSLFGTNGFAASLVTLLACAIVYFLIVNTSDDQGMELTNMLVFAVVLALVYGLLQIFGIYIVRMPFALSHAFNTVGSVNGLGVLAAAGLPLLANRRLNGWRTYVRLAGFVAAMALLVILNWWVLWTIAIVGMAATIAFESLAQERFSLGRFVLPMTVIVIAAFSMVVNLNITALKQNLPIEVAPSFRLSAKVTESALKERFVTGYGPETFSLAFDKYGASELSDSTLSSAKFFDATSEVFNAVVQGGVLMIVALLILGLSVIQGIMHYVRNKNALRSEGAQAVWATLVALGAAFLLYPFSITLMFMTYVVLALAALSLWGRTQKQSNIEDNVSLSLISSLGFIGGLILVLIGVYFGASAYIADVRYAQALSGKNIDEVASDLVSAVNWNGQKDAYYRSASQAALGLLSQELNKVADPKDTQRTARIQNYMSSAVNLAKTATDIGPREASNWQNLGSVYQNLLGLVDGTDALAEVAYLKAAELRPGDASFHNQIGNMYLAKSQLLRQMASGSPNAAQLNQDAVTALTNAEKNFKKSIELSNNFGLAIYNLGVVYDAQGKLPEAIKQLERIAPFNSDQPNLLFQLGLLYYRNGDKDKAFNALQNVLVLQPDFANAHWYLSLIYEERKDIPNAISELQKILSVEANKDNKTVQDKLTQLQAGQPTPPTGIDQKPL